MSIIDHIKSLLHAATEPKVAPHDHPVPLAKVVEPDTDAMGDLILQQLRAAGMIAEGTQVKVKHIKVGPGLKPPADAAADGWTWEHWAKEMRVMGFPGWSPCRFAHRVTPHGQPEGARFVFGITRGPFGLWQQNFDVCAHDDDNGWEQASDTLTCLTHLPSGMGLGIFATKDAAALAADTAIRTCPGWPDVEWSSVPGSPWSDLINRTVKSWGMIGLGAADNAHAHDPNTGAGPYMIMGLNESLEANRPEKLS